jgi:hypothetical protein
MISYARIRNTAFSAALVSVLLGSIFVGHRQAEAQVVPVKVTSFQVSSVDGRAVGAQPLMAGATYRVSFTLEVAAGVRDRITLKTDMSRVSDRYWSLSGNYSGIDVRTWQPGQAELSFNPVEGRAQMELQGSISDVFVQVKSPSGEILHVSKSISLLQVSLPNSRIVENRTQEVIDRSIETYRAVLASKQQTLAANNSTDQRFVRLVQAMIAGAKGEADRGYTESATSLLNAIPDSGWIGPKASTWYQWVIIGILAVIAIVLGMSVFRGRTNLDFAKRRVDEQAKRLEILSSRAKGIGDIRLSEEIGRVKKDLEEISGR